MRFTNDMFLILDFNNEKITDGETPAPITKAFLFSALLISFKYAACNPNTSVFSPTIELVSSRKLY